MISRRAGPFWFWLDRAKNDERKENKAPNSEGSLSSSSILGRLLNGYAPMEFVQQPAAQLKSPGR